MKGKTKEMENDLPDKYEKVVSEDRTYARIIFFLSDLEPGVASNVVNFMGPVP